MPPGAGGRIAYFQNLNAHQTGQSSGLRRLGGLTEFSYVAIQYPRPGWEILIPFPFERRDKACVCGTCLSLRIDSGNVARCSSLSGDRRMSFGFVGGKRAKLHGNVRKHRTQPCRIVSLLLPAQVTIRITVDGVSIAVSVAVTLHYRV